MSLIDLISVHGLAAAYPQTPGRLRHFLADEPLLGCGSLADAARRLPPFHVEQRVHDAADGEAFRMIPDAADAATTIAEGCADRTWIMLRYIEQLPDYHALIHRLLGELAPAIGAVPSAVCDVKGFVFISAPDTHTPFHFDAEYNILFQISGDKIFCRLPPRTAVPRA